MVVESDTGGLRSVRAGRRSRDRASQGRPGRLAAALTHRSVGELFRLALFVGLALAVDGCAREPSAPPSEPTPNERERATVLLDPAALLPSRAETVALADAVAVASAKAGKTPEGAALARLAADLRTRLWRLDQSAADAREALELYAAAAGAAAGTEEGCEADRRRALLAGEFGRDAAAVYRELYLTSRRQAVLVAAPGGRSGGARSPCLTSLDSALASADAYRPPSDVMHGFEQEGNIAAERALRGVAPVADASGLSAPPAPTPSSNSGRAVSTAGDVVVAPAQQLVPTGPVKILGIDRFGSDKAARVVVRLSAPAAFDVGALGPDNAHGKDARVFVDIPRASARGIPRETEVGGAVRRVRVGAQTSGTRVVLDVASDLHRRVFYLPDPFRIVIDVSTRAPIRQETLGEGGKREVRRVVLDPGHGGNDTGAVGPTGLREKDVTLDIAHRAAPLLAHELQVDTLLTRDSDAYVSLDLRAARANAFHADLFVSIHCNASEDGVARGVQTFYLDEVREAGSAALRVAARENLPHARGDDAHTPAGAETEIASILASLQVGATASRSRHVADLLQRSALASLLPRYADTRDQGVKTAGFYVLAGADMPAVLFETAFISNPVEEARLATADYRQKMADAIVNAIRAYREGK